MDRFWPGRIGGSGRRSALCSSDRRKDPQAAPQSVDDGVDYLEDAAAYLKEQAEYLSKEAQKTIKRTHGQVEEVVDKAADVVQAQSRACQSLM